MEYPLQGKNREKRRSSDALLKEVERFSDYPVQVLSDRLVMKHHNGKFTDYQEADSVSPASLARCLTELFYVVFNAKLYGGSIDKIHLMKLRNSPDSRLFVEYSISAKPDIADGKPIPLAQLYCNIYRTHFARLVERSQQVRHAVELNNLAAADLAQFEQKLLDSSQQSDDRFVYNIENTRLFLKWSKFLEIINYSLLSLLAQPSSLKGLRLLDELKLRWQVEAEEQNSFCGNNLIDLLRNRYPEGATLHDYSSYITATGSNYTKQLVPLSCSERDYSTNRAIRSNIVVMFQSLGFKEMGFSDYQQHKSLMSDIKEIRLLMQREFFSKDPLVEKDNSRELVKLLISISPRQNLLVVDVIIAPNKALMISFDSFGLNVSFVNARLSYQLSFFTFSKESLRVYNNFQSNTECASFKELVVRQQSSINMSRTWINRVVLLAETSLIAYRVLKKEFYQEHDLKALEVAIEQSRKLIDHYMANVQNIYDHLFQPDNKN